MSKDPFGAVPADRRESARSAFARMAGSAGVRAIAPAAGGASGAAVFRVEAGARRYLMRLEGPESPLLRRNPHRHACAAAAARAGIAPAIHLIDEESGVAVTDFIEQRPLHSFPGGAAALAAAVGEMLGRLQATTAFPGLVDYRDLVGDMLERVRRTEIFGLGLLDAHVARLEKLRAACAWDPDGWVSSHNDPMPGNILFDGRRLWLIDWEAAYGNDPLIDVAIVLDWLAPTRELESVLLSRWLGRAPDAAVLDRLALIRPLTRLYYACFLLSASAADPSVAPEVDLASPSPSQLQRALAGGRGAPATPRVTSLLGKMFLDAFLTGRSAPGLGKAIIAAVGQE